MGISKVFIFTTLVFLGQLTFGQKPLVLTNDQSRYDFGQQSEILEDASLKLTIEDICSGKYEDRFFKSNATVPNFGFSKSAYWIRFKVQNCSSEGKEWLLEAGNTVMVNFEFYSFQEGRAMKKVQIGRCTPLENREIESRKFLFSLSSNNCSTETIYLHTGGNDVKIFALTIWDKKEFRKYESDHDVYLAFLFGILFALIFYNLFLYISIRERAFLFYVLYMLSFFLVQVFYTGWYLLHMPSGILFNNYTFFIYPYATCFFGTLFSLYFLQIKNYFPYIFKIYLIYLAILVLIVFGGILFSELYFDLFAIGILMSFLPTLALLVQAIVIAKKGSRDAQYYLIGWSVLLLAAGITILKHFGWIPLTPFTAQLTRLAVIFEAIILSVGLADRYNTSKVQLQLKTLEADKLAELDKVKSDFFANITHEFRTPLTLISAPIKKLIAEERLETPILDQLKLVEKNAAHLNRLITQLLDISKLDGGALAVLQQPLRIDTFFKLIEATFRSVAQNKKIEFEMIYQLSDRVILMDEDKLEVIVYNILSNAFKFTVEGKIQLTATLSYKPNQLGIVVLDTGRGLSEENIPRIFERFYQVNQEGADLGGTGIGLALTKELVTLMGGTIQVESRLGIGSRFCIEIPTIVMDLPEGAPSSAIIENNNNWREEISDGIFDNALPNNDRPIVLIVEDNYDLRQFIYSGLKDKYETVLAINGIEGFNLAQKNLPDIILTDWMMPDMDGIALCELLKSDPITNHIPVILITAKADTESKLKGLKTGVDDYIYKPFEFEELAYKVQNRIEKQKLLQEKLRKNLLFEPDPVNNVFSEDEKFLFMFKKVVEKNLRDEQLSVEFLRKELGLSRVQLSRKVNALLGIPINEYIRLFRLKKAVQLLDRKWGAVSDVAYEVGFTNLSYFSKCFKAYCGKTPSEYIK
jgi:signal transduction histidine kinase/DNA-binding response OmpR family regulator